MSKDEVRSSVGGSSTHGATREVFDLSNEADTVQVLQKVHRSTLDPDTKNTLRDAVFAYRQSREHTELTSACELFAGAGITVTSCDPDSPRSHAPGQSKRGIGFARSKPRFGVTKKQDKSSHSHRPVKRQGNESGLLNQDASKNQPVPPKADAVPVAPAPAPEPERSQSAHVAASEPAPAAEPASVTPAAPAAESVKESAATPQEVEQSVPPAPTPEVQKESEVPTATDSSPTKNPVDRINEIKRLVNQKIGNPVNLIDADNTIGREYMNALLGAMKLSNGGQPSELSAAMHRLEESYKAVTKLLDAKVGAVPLSTPEVAPAEQPAPPEPVAQSTDKTEPAEDVSEHSVAPVEAPASSDTQAPALEEEVPAPASTPEPAPSASEKEPTHQPTPPARKSKIPLADIKVPSAPRSNESAAPVHATPAAAQHDNVSLPRESTPEPASAPEPPPPEPVAPAPPTPTPPSPSQPVAPSTPEPAVASAPVSAPAEPQPRSNTDARAEGLSSVAKAKQVQDLMRKEMSSEAEKADIEQRLLEQGMDPLQVPAVTEGLKQLLSEWGLFKSSGIFGTGPSGIEHPLYKRLAPLPMQAVVAGRFEGATPQIRQSVSDYMNGWRYEEGVVFDYGESFEHYLRRVIRHIIDKKNTQNESAERKQK